MSEGRLRQPIVVVLGHVDHGKCLHPEEEVMLASGEFVEISRLYSEGFREVEVDGYKRVRTKIPLYTLTPRGLEVSIATHVWKVDYEAHLYKVVLEDGLSIRVTPEHPFLTGRGWVKAEELVEGEYVAVAPHLTNASTPQTLRNLEREDSLGNSLRGVLNYMFYVGGFIAGRGKGLDEGLKLIPSQYRDNLASDVIKRVEALSKTGNGLPREVHKAPVSLVWHYLAGYIYGKTGKERGREYILRDNLKTLKHVKLLISKFNQDSVLYEEDSKLTLRFKDEINVNVEHPLHHPPLNPRDIMFLKVKKVEKLKFRGVLYDLTVPPFNNFIANTILVHNTTLLDKIRGTAVARREPGEITQHVGASLIPSHVIEKVTEPLKKMFKIKLTIPGLLFIDTPGHELFSNLRRRGGSVADFAILVVDVIEGFQPQTFESIDILKRRRVPFLVAANKVDRVPGWKPYPDAPIIESLTRQADSVKWRLEELIYRISGELSKLGFSAERFDRIRDFTRTVAIVPVSAKTGEGIAELLAVLAGLTQQYLKKKLKYAEGPGKGVVLEVKEEPGLGTTIDIILYDGMLRRGDLIVVGGLEEAYSTKIRALLMPKPLEEIRAPESKFLQVEEVYAAAGVKISAPNLEKVVAGSPIYAVWREEEIEEFKKKVLEEVLSVRVRTDKEGVVVKADTLGTLEAIVEALKREGIPVRIADVGPISRRDVIEAAVSLEKDKTYSVILGFNVKLLPEAELEARNLGVKIFINNVIYKLLEDYLEWSKNVREAEKRAELEAMIRPGKIRILPGYVFRRSDPIIVGVEVLGGTIRPGYPLVTVDGKKVGEIQQIQERGEPLKEAKAGMAVAISIRGRAMVGRQVDEGDILYNDIPETHIRTWLTKYRSELSEDEMLVLREYMKISRKGLYLIS